MNKFLLWLEMVVLFVVPPLLIIEKILPPAAIIPGLWVLTLYSVIILRLNKEPIFEVEHGNMKPIYQRYILLSLFTTLILFAIGYEALFELFYVNPFMLLAIAIFYPLFSALPQEILFRRFFFYRYNGLINKEGLLTLGALLFAYVHLPFGNYIAVIGSFIGGILFTRSYILTGSIRASWIEHSLYGVSIFAVGLGQYFYHGNIN